MKNSKKKRSVTRREKKVELYSKPLDISSRAESPLPTSATELAVSTAPRRFRKPLARIIIVITSLIALYSSKNNIHDFWFNWILQKPFVVELVQSDFYPDYRYEVNTEDDIRYWYAENEITIKIDNKLLTDQILIDSMIVRSSKTNLSGIQYVERIEIPPNSIREFKFSFGFGDDEQRIKSIREVDQAIFIYSDLGVVKYRIPYIIRYKVRGMRVLDTLRFTSVRR